MSWLRDEGIIIYKPNRIHSGYFSDIRDIAMQLSLNGVQLFKIGTHQVWPFLILNLNRPPESRFKIRNFLPLGLSPDIYLFHVYYLFARSSGTR